MGCHGCSAITCLTAQNSVGVTDVHIPPPEFLRKQLNTLADDLPPLAIKIGMLANKELAEVVGEFLLDLKTRHGSDQKIWVVLDPVMISTSGSKLLEDDAVDAMIQHIFPLCDVLTPNKFEAEALLKRRLDTPTDVEDGARELLKLGCRSVLIKGGHTLVENSFSDKVSSSSSSSPPPPPSPEVQSTLQYAQDFLISSDVPPPSDDWRICDSSPDGVWLRSTRWDSKHTHGTGCTLSSAMAAALALGEQNRRLTTRDGNIATERVGATSSIGIVDAACLAKAYVSCGIRHSCGLGSGPGPVAQTSFPSSWQDFPSIVSWDSPASDGTHSSSFRPMQSYARHNAEESSNVTPHNDVISTPLVLGRILPIVDTVAWVQRLCQTPGVTDIQLRIKDINETTAIADRVQLCQEYCAENNVRLWINDHWEAAIQSGCFGVHLGQEDLAKCVRSGGIEQLRSKQIALGVSTHSYGELAVALGVQPTYISMGPVFETSSKNVKFDPQGLATVKKWRELIPPTIPFVSIGGINDAAAANSNREAGSDCVAVIGAITKSDNIPRSVELLNSAMTKPSLIM
jgi:hydroxymethylpyrimidine kinase/phosphomethylpyrimidine kinase/thiamine-phosphate diphosphorylase